MTVDERNAAAVKRAGAAPEAVADAATANKRLHASLTAIVRAGIEAGAFENPLDGRTWTPAWRAVLALTALRFRVLARRCAVGPVAPAAHSPAVLLELLDSLTAPEGCSLLAVMLEAMPALERAPVKAAETHSPAAAPVAVGEARKPVVMLLADVRAVFKAKGTRSASVPRRSIARCVSFPIGPGGRCRAPAKRFPHKGADACWRRSASARERSSSTARRTRRATSARRSSRHGAHCFESSPR